MLRAVRNSLFASSLALSFTIPQIAYSTNEAYLFAFTFVEFNSLDSLKKYSREELLLARDEEGNSLLLYAVKSRKIDIIKYLISLKIFNLNEANYHGVSVISYLQARKDRELNELFFSQGSVFNFRISPAEFETQLELKKPMSLIFDSFENSILHYAIVKNQMDFLQIVVKNHKIDLRKRNIDGIFPEYLAKKMGNTEALAILANAINDRLTLKARNAERKYKISPLSQEITFE